MKTYTWLKILKLFLVQIQTHLKGTVVEFSQFFEFDLAPVFEFYLHQDPVALAERESLH